MNIELPNEKKDLHDMSDGHPMKGAFYLPTELSLGPLAAEIPSLSAGELIPEDNEVTATLAIDPTVIDASVPTNKDNLTDDPLKQSDIINFLPVKRCTSQPLPSLTNLEPPKKYSNKRKGRKKTTFRGTDSSPHLESAPLLMTPNLPDSLTGDDLSKVVSSAIQCYICRAIFYTKEQLIHHLSTEHKAMPYKCTRCRKSFSTAADLEAHQAVHDVLASSTFDCYLCDKKYQTACSLQQHLKDGHSAVKFPCDLCNREFAALRYLKEHKVKKHSDRPKPVCPICHKSFHSQSELISHTTVHTGERPYACHICPKTFRTRAVLRTHIKAHIGLRDKVCEQCGQGFIQKSDLVKHLRRHTGANPYACDRCDRVFMRRDYLVKHQLVHARKLAKQKGELVRQTPKRRLRGGAVENAAESFSTGRRRRSKTVTGAVTGSFDGPVSGDHHVEENAELSVVVLGSEERNNDSAVVNATLENKPTKTDDPDISDKNVSVGSRADNVPTGESDRINSPQGSQLLLDDLGDEPMRVLEGIVVEDGDNMQVVRILDQNLAIRDLVI